MMDGEAHWETQQANVAANTNALTPQPADAQITLKPTLTNRLHIQNVLSVLQL